MIKLYKYPDKSQWKELLRRPSLENVSIEKTVKEILKVVKHEKDTAIYQYSLEFDNIVISNLAVDKKEISDAAMIIGGELKSAILQAKNNIDQFHRSQTETVVKVTPMTGITCWRKSLPIEKVGLYIPGGTAPLFSTVLMLGVPAQIAGCREIILCTPSLHPAILYAASLCGIHQIFQVGGAQAIAAMAYGTETIPKVLKIFGPGNKYVTTAKQLVQQEGIAIDMLAGPSELLIIADECSVPAFIAADILSQAEHGPDSQVILLTTSESIAMKVTASLLEQIRNLPRKETAEAALQNSGIIIVESLEEAIEISNYYSPEHLILACENAVQLGEKVGSAGSVFLGNYSPEAVGDYASGTNHTLPTNGQAAVQGGVSLESFMKKISFQQLTKVGLENIASTVMTMAAAEGLEGHKNAIRCRL